MRRWPRIATYRGDFVFGIVNGNGTLTSHAGGWLYRGAWVNNRKSGRGVMEWGDGSYYDGDFVADKRHGQGHFVSSRGDLHTGGYDNRGRGVLVTTNGFEYAGEFVDDMRHGKGVYTMRDGSSIEATTERGDIVSSAVLKHSDPEPCLACKVSTRTANPE
jgi:hypothetical protein